MEGAEAGWAAADAPLLVHARWDPALFAWLARFLANCTAARLRVNIERALRLALYSRRQLAVVRAETGIAYDQLDRGILHIFRNRRDYEEALPGVELMNRLGCTRTVVDADECVALEPALSAARSRLIGGIFSPDDESGDAHPFTRRLGGGCERAGVTFVYGANGPPPASRRAIGSPRSRPTPAPSTAMASSSRSPAIRRCCCARSASACRSIPARVTR